MLIHLAGMAGVKDLLTMRTPQLHRHPQLKDDMTEAHHLHLYPMSVNLMNMGTLGAVVMARTHLDPMSTATTVAIIITMGQEEAMEDVGVVGHAAVEDGVDHHLDVDTQADLGGLLEGQATQASICLV